MLILDPLVFRWLPQHAWFSFLQGLEKMSSRKSRFLRMEHTRMVERVLYITLECLKLQRVNQCK